MNETIIRQESQQARQSMRPASVSVEQAMHRLGEKARAAARELAGASAAAKSAALNAMAEGVKGAADEILAVNARDVKAAQEAGLSSALLERLALSRATVDRMAQGVRDIAAVPDIIGTTTEASVRPNGIRIAKMRVPLGVVGIIYESRPNVTIDAAALCLKAGNASILRGGSEALDTNRVLARIIRQGLMAAHLPMDAVQVVDTPDRAAVGALLAMDDFIDVLIPRGGRSLVERVSKEARMPLLKHMNGNCHVYIDAAADVDEAIAIAFNAKTYRYGICGAMETLLVHADIAPTVLPRLGKKLLDHGVALHGCDVTRALVPQATPASDEDWATEYLGPTLAVRVVDSIGDAIAHIELWGSHHTDAIVTEDAAAAQRFQREVDSSSVYVNLPTCFADGYEYGLGGEIGISTNRLHVRGPVGVEGLTTLKWVLSGEGQLRG
jgi:glutamate-5-semialdehyde dehydrogenase